MRALLRRLLLLALCLLWLDLAQAGAATPDMAERVRPCTQCHGAQGRAGPDGYYPRLAGKPAEYLLHQLQNIREDRRHYRLMQGLIDSLDDASLRRVLDVNVAGAFLCAREAVRRMSSRHGGQGGAIVNVSSRAAEMGGAGEWVHYAASKGALDTLTIGLARQKLDDDVPEERALGIEAGLSWGPKAAATVCYVDLGVSGGMRIGIERAEKEKRPVEYRTVPGWKWPQG